MLWIECLGSIPAFKELSFQGRLSFVRMQDLGLGFYRVKKWCYGVIRDFPSVMGLRMQVAPVGSGLIVGQPVTCWFAVKERG